MRISFKIERDEAVIALMYYLGLGIQIKNRNDFKNELTDYFRQNGTQCLHDHESENEYHRKNAERLIEKYFI